MQCYLTLKIQTFENASALDSSSSTATLFFCGAVRSFTFKYRCFCVSQKVRISCCFPILTQQILMDSCWFSENRWLLRQKRLQFQKRVENVDKSIKFRSIIVLMQRNSVIQTINKIPNVRKVRDKIICSNSPYLRSQLLFRRQNWHVNILFGPWK